MLWFEFVIIFGFIMFLEMVVLGFYVEEIYVCTFCIMVHREYDWLIFPERL